MAISLQVIQLEEKYKTLQEEYNKLLEKQENLSKKHKESISKYEQEIFTLRLQTKVFKYVLDLNKISYSDFLEETEDDLIIKKYNIVFQDDQGKVISRDQEKHKKSREEKELKYHCVPKSRKITRKELEEKQEHITRVKKEINTSQNNIKEIKEELNANFEKLKKKYHSPLLEKNRKLIDSLLGKINIQQYKCLLEQNLEIYKSMGISEQKCAKAHSPLDHRILELYQYKSRIDPDHIERCRTAWIRDLHIEK